MDEQIDYKPDSGPDFLDSWWWRIAFRRAGWMPEFQVFRSGWLRGWRLNWIHRYVQFKTIVNLAHVTGKGRDRREARWAAKREIRLVRYKWGSGGPPHDLSEPKMVAQAVLRHYEKPIWVHCVAGKDRTGALIGVMQQMMGASWDQVWAIWKKFGRPNPRWVEYVGSLF